MKMTRRIAQLLALSLALVMALPISASAASGGKGGGAAGSAAGEKAPATKDKPAPSDKGNTKTDKVKNTACVPAPTDPATGTTDPATGTTDPATGTTDPATGTTDPATGTTDPATGTTDPATGTETEEEDAAEPEEEESEEPEDEESEEPEECEDDSDAPSQGKGKEVSAAAHAKVAARLQALLDSGKITNENARANMEAVIAKMLGEAKTEGDAATDEEALAEVEEALEAEGEAATAAELDVLAEVQKRQGKKEEAKATLKTRLEKNPATKAAYEELIKLEAESGEKQDLDTYVAGKKVKFDVRPKVKEGRTMVPIRALVEALGAEVKWDAATRTVTILKGETKIELKIGSNVALVNGKEVKLDVPASIDEERTMIPARFVSEGLGLYVSWLAEQRTILITEEPVVEQPVTEQPATEQPATEQPATGSGN